MIVIEVTMKREGTMRRMKDSSKEEAIESMNTMTRGRKSLRESKQAREIKVDHTRLTQRCVKNPIVKVTVVVAALIQVQEAMETLATSNTRSGRSLELNTEYMDEFTNI